MAGLVVGVGAIACCVWVCSEAGRDRRWMGVIGNGICGLRMACWLRDAGLRLGLDDWRVRELEVEEWLPLGGEVGRDGSRPDAVLVWGGLVFAVGFWDVELEGRLEDFEVSNGAGAREFRTPIF